MRGIADTGFIVAFGNRNDHYHSWATALAKEISDPLLTCEPVLAEAVFQLSSASLVLAHLKDGLLKISFGLDENLNHINELAKKYEDRNPDLADLCLVRMSELYPKHAILTVDNDFTVYRRNKRELIPLLRPPGRND